VRCANALVLTTSLLSRFLIRWLTFLTLDYGYAFVFITVCSTLILLLTQAWRKDTFSLGRRIKPSGFFFNRPVYLSVFPTALPIYHLNFVTPVWVICAWRSGSPICNLDSIIFCTDLFLTKKNPERVISKLVCQLEHSRRMFRKQQHTS
jgi:hypothetical protein